MITVVVCQTLLGTLNLRLQFLSRTIQPVGGSRKPVYLALMVSLNEHLGQAIGYRGCYHRIRMSERNLQRLSVLNVVNFQSAFEYRDKSVEFWILDVQTTCITLRIGLSWLRRR